MKGLNRYIVSVITALALFLSAVTVAAAPGGRAVLKEEVVYAVLSALGTPEQVFAVNIFGAWPGGTITDYGDYTDVVNLTDTAPPVRDGDKVTFEAGQGNFYYQGTMASAELPWIIDIEYYLDGELMPPENLAGRDGHLDIFIRVSQNGAEGINPMFWERYLLQVTVKLDAEKCANLTAPGGQTAVAGLNRQAVFTMLPGVGGDAMLSADVTEFTMEGIDIAAVPYSMNIDLSSLDIIDDGMSFVTDIVTSLEEGVGMLLSGAEALKDGAAELSGGSAQFAEGINTLAKGSEELTDGSLAIKNGLEEMAAGLNSSTAGFDISAIMGLPNTLSQFSAALGETAANLRQTQSSLEAVANALEDAFLLIPDSVVSPKQWDALYSDNPDGALIDLLRDYYDAARAAATVCSEALPRLRTAAKEAGQAAADANRISSSMTGLALLISFSVSSMDIDGLTEELTDGVNLLADGYADFHEGLMAYTGGVLELAEAYGGLDEGVSGLSGGLEGLHGGVLELYDGVSSMGDMAEELPSYIEKEMGGIAGGGEDFTPVSFTSPKNGDAAAVQFVFKTKDIEMHAAEKEDVMKEKESIWTKLINLFK